MGLWKKQKQRQEELNELKIECEKQRLFQAGRGLGKSTAGAAAALQEQLAAQVFSGTPTFDDRGNRMGPRGSAADGVVDDVIAKLKAGDYS